MLLSFQKIGTHLPAAFYRSSYRSSYRPYVAIYSALSTAPLLTRLWQGD